MTEQARPAPAAACFIAANPSRFWEKFVTLLMMTARLTPKENTAARKRLKQAKADLAISGMALTPSEEAMFAEFDAEALPHAERRRRILASLGISAPVADE